MKNLLLALSFSLLVGCTHALHMNHTGDIQTLGKGIRVKSQGEQFTVLGFVTQTDYVNRAFNDLKRQCVGKKLTGIQTRYSTSHSFFSWTNKVKMTAYCN